MESQKIDTYAKSYVEILAIINYMGETYKEKIPPKLIEFFEKNKDSNYNFELGNIKSDNMNTFSDKTICLLSILEYKYWTNDYEKKVLMGALIKNEKEYQKELRLKYDPDNIFKSKEAKKEIIEKPVAIIEYKETFFTKIVNWFKRNLFLWIT